MFIAVPVGTISSWLLVVVDFGKSLTAKDAKRIRKERKEKTHVKFFAPFAAFLCELRG
jgi:hypothetical protein